MQTVKPYGQFERSVFEIRAIRENAHLIARCSYLSSIVAYLHNNIATCVRACVTKFAHNCYVITRVCKHFQYNVISSMLSINLTRNMIGRFDCPVQSSQNDITMKKNLKCILHYVSCSFGLVRSDKITHVIP